MEDNYIFKPVILVISHEVRWHDLGEFVICDCVVIVLIIIVVINFVLFHLFGWFHDVVNYFPFSELM